MCSLLVQLVPQLKDVPIGCFNYGQVNDMVGPGTVCRSLVFVHVNSHLRPSLAPRSFHCGACMSLREIYACTVASCILFVILLPSKSNNISDTSFTIRYEAMILFSHSL